MCFLAMPANSDNAASSTPSDNIEIIEVNAQKRPQDIRDVALSLNFIDGQTIIERQLKDTTALSAITPNFKITQNCAAGTSANSQLMNLFDAESVEILRGPQGTLFGRNTTDGAILVNSVSAKMYNSGYFNLGYAQRNHLSAEGAINRPLNDNMAARLAFSQQDYEYPPTTYSRSLLKQKCVRLMADYLF